MFKKIFFLIAIALTLLTGCATNSENRASPGFAPNLTDSGVIMLPVTDRALFTPYGVTFVLQDSKRKLYHINVDQWPQVIPVGEGRGARYYSAIVLPVGQYKIVFWSFNMVDGLSDFPTEDMLFNVEKGGVSYLGNFNVIRFQEKGQFRDRFDEDMKQYMTIYPWLKDYTVKQQQMKSTWWEIPQKKNSK
jgi:hypothetical protein